MSKFSLLPFIFSLLTACQTSLSPDKATIAILPMDCDKSNLAKLSDDIEAFYNCNCVILAPEALPQSAYFKPRQRYRADSLLKSLKHRICDTVDIILAVTSKDISTSIESHKDWGVFGLAHCPGNVCVISDFRLQKTKTPTALATCLKNVALHEIGHNLGLVHCGDSACLMKDAQGKLSSVEGENRSFCKRCRERLEE